MALAEGVQEAHAETQRLRAWLYAIALESTPSRSRDSAAAALRGDAAPDVPPVPVPPREGPCPRSALPMQPPPSMPPLHHGASYNE